MCLIYITKFCVGGHTIELAVCPPLLSGRFVSPEYRTFRSKPSGLMSDYLAMIVPTEWFWGQLSKMTRGVGARRERIRPEVFLELALPMPVLKDQEHGLKVFKALQKTNVDRATIPQELNALLPAVLDRAFRGEL